MGYSYIEAKNLFHNLDTKGRQAYLYQQIPLDLIFPILFAISFICIYFLKKLNLLETQFIYIVLLPIISALFDYTENICIICILEIYPILSKNLIELSSFFTIIKDIYYTISFITLIFVVVKYLINY